MYRISFAAHSEEPSQELAEAIRVLVRRLYERLGDKIIFYMGGYYGTMKYIADEACKYNIQSIFILPYSSYDVPRHRCFIPIKTGMEMRERSEIIILSGDVLIAVGGYAGTIIEILMAYSNNRNSYVLTGYSMPSDLIEKIYSPHVDPRKNALIKYFYRDPIRLADEVSRELIEKIRIATS
ncbi:MAG: LOG family protein [Sulfolobales archaeon]